VYCPHLFINVQQIYAHSRSVWTAIEVLLLFLRPWSHRPIPESTDQFNGHSESGAVTGHPAGQLSWVELSRVELSRPGWRDHGFRRQKSNDMKSTYTRHSDISGANLMESPAVNVTYDASLVTSAAARTQSRYKQRGRWNQRMTRHPPSPNNGIACSICDRRCAFEFGLRGHLQSQRQLQSRDESVSGIPMSRYKLRVLRPTVGGKYYCIV